MTRAEQNNQEYCDVCDNKGFVLVKEMVQVSKSARMQYEYVYYCPYCAAGNVYAYDGRQCKKENSSGYWVPPITEVFGDNIINQLRQKNRDLQKKREKKKSEKNITGNINTVTGQTDKTVEDEGDFRLGDAFEVIDVLGW